MTETIKESTWDAIVSLLSPAYPSLTGEDLKQAVETTTREKTEYLTMKEACAMLRCSRSTVWRLATDGKIRVAHPVGGRTLYSLGDIRRLLGA